MPSVNQCSFCFVLLEIIIAISMKKMINTAFVRLMLLFLGFSYLLFSCAAVPSPRSLNSIKEIPSSSGQDLLSQDASEANQVLFGEVDGFILERMLMESNDYPGTGPNKGHDPKPPGKAN